MSEDKTKVTIVSAKVSIELDAGYVPFMEVVRFYKGKNIPFGMRDATRVKFDIFMSAEVGEGDDPDAVTTSLLRQAHAIADRELRAVYPESFEEAEKIEVPEEAFTIQSTVVERQAVPVGEDF